MEEISIGERIRDILEGHNGEIVLWTDSESMFFLEPSTTDSTSGESLYVMCTGCHLSHDPRGSSIGPSLTGILGRQVASQPGFEYTQALEALGGTWTEERLDAFLQNPSAYAPGTSMQLPGLPDPVSRAQLIEYLISPESRLDQAPPPEIN
jgi:cytochrome c